MSFDKSYFMIPQGYSNVGAPSDAVNSLSPFSQLKTNVNSTSPLYAPIGSTGGNTYPANGQFSTIVVNTQPGQAGVAIEENSNGYAALYFNTPTSSDVNYQLQTQPTANPAVRTLYLNATAVNTDGALRGNANLTTLSFPDANLNISTINGSVPGGGSFISSISSISNANATVECTTSSVIQATGDFIINTASAGFINNTTSTGANLYIGSTDGATPSNIIYANTSTLACQYNLTCQLLNGLAPPVVYGTNQVIITPGNLTTNFNLPPLSGAGYTWVANVTPFGFIVGANPTWSCQVAGDVLTVSINNVQAGNVQFNTIASAYK